MIDIIIINYNCKEHLQNLLLELPSQQKFTITIVDNASTDGSASFVREQHPSLTCITLPQNLGYSAAVNRGLDATQAGKILLINSDIFLPQDQVLQLETVWSKTTPHGIIGPLHLENDDFPQLTYGYTPTFFTEWKRKQNEQRLQNRDQNTKHRLFDTQPSTHPVDWLSGSCLFFSREMAENIGPWDENFFLYFEDMDWCLRAKQRGYPVYFTREVHVSHHHGASMRQHRPLAERSYRLSQVYFAKKHYSFYKLLFIRIYLTCKLVTRLIKPTHKRTWVLKTIIQLWQNPGNSR